MARFHTTGALRYFFKQHKTGSLLSVLLRPLWQSEHPQSSHLKRPTGDLSDVEIDSFFYAGLGIELPGNPTLFSSLVHCCHVGGMPLSEQQQHQIISTFCRGALLMDTEAAAGQYRRHVTQHRSCASIVCRDTGSVIAADGGFAIGHGATAPSSISQLRTCLGAPRKESTEAFRRCSAALASLQSMPWLLHQISVAQVRSHRIEKICRCCP